YNSSFVFFFQAEDGIRDYKVTGVQTCALPILGSSSGLRRACTSVRTRAGTSLLDRSTTSPTQHTLEVSNRSLAPTSSGPLGASRSEERRVGKECRSRRSP